MRQADVELVVTHKVGVITLQGIEDERLVSLRDLEVEASTVGQIKFGDDGLHAQPGQLRVHLDVDIVGPHPG